MNFHKEGLDDKIVELLHIWTRAPRLDRLGSGSSSSYKSPKYAVTIAIVGKYVDLTESYKSLNEALYHGGVANNCRVNLVFVDSETIDRNTCATILPEADGILVPGGFGTRGIEGKMLAARYARENQVPYLRHMPGDAGRRDRVRPPRGRHGRCPQRGIRSENTPLSGDLPDAGMV